MSRELVCRAGGVEIDGTSHVEVCEDVREAFADHPRSDELIVTVDIRSRYNASGMVTDRNGAILVEREFTIMDRVLHRSAIKGFVNELVRASL